MSTETIYMPLLDEGTDVWTPVQAKRQTANTFLVLGPQPDDQLWGFAPNTIVGVEHKIFAGGKDGLIVTRFVGLPAIMTQGWVGVEAEIKKIIDEAPAPFDAQTSANVYDLLSFLRDRDPLPDAVDKGYWSTVCFTWGNFEIQVFGDHLEGSRFYEQRTDIWYEDHTAGEPFSPKVVSALSTL